MGALKAVGLILAIALLIAFDAALLTHSFGAMLLTSVPSPWARG